MATTLARALCQAAGAICPQGQHAKAGQSLQQKQHAALSQHYAELMEHIVRSSSRVGDVVLDPFMESGSTGKACLKLDHQFIGVDMDKHWCEQLIICPDAGTEHGWVIPPQIN